MKGAQHPGRMRAGPAKIVADRQIAFQPSRPVWPIYLDLAPNPLHRALAQEAEECADRCVLGSASAMTSIMSIRASMTVIIPHIVNPAAPAVTGSSSITFRYDCAQRAENSCNKLPSAPSSPRAVRILRVKSLNCYRLLKLSTCLDVAPSLGTLLECRWKDLEERGSRPRRSQRASAVDPFSA